MRIIPALAGNTPPLTPISLTSVDHPRSRGEYLPGADPRGDDPGSSPLSRGILGQSWKDHRAKGIIPALAGNTSVLAYQGGGSADHPRSRGEYPVGWAGVSLGAGSSPLSRGILENHTQGFPRPGIIPALAGNTALRGVPGMTRRDHPRSRGEYNRIFSIPALSPGSSPLSRGILGGGTGQSADRRIIPALAGNTHRVGEPTHEMADHPRSRGEYEVTQAVTLCSAGSSPLSRGIPARPAAPPQPYGIIPALAGNTSAPESLSPSLSDHPRSRGEYSGGRGPRVAAGGSSPLSRGILGRSRAAGRSRRIIPALAGNTWTPAPVPRRPPDHPRSRGEYGGRRRPNLPRYGSSPLSRGIPTRRAQRPRQEWIIPALAGNTSATSDRALGPRDHPRSRGEYTQSDCPGTPSKTDHPRSRGEYRCVRAVGGWRAGSSPLSRGILEHHKHRFARPGIIPALAGNTAVVGAERTGGWDHPRSRGEYSPLFSWDSFHSGSSPLSRGIPGGLEGGVRTPSDHPRSRGEYGSAARSVAYRQGSSPLSRGILPYGVLITPSFRIIPALAGNTRRFFPGILSTPDHPRSRGEYATSAAAPPRTAGSSPLSRGILASRSPGGGHSRIIPALAGNTLGP